MATASLVFDNNNNCLVTATESALRARSVPLTIKQLMYRTR